MALQASRFVRNGPKTLAFALAFLLLAPAAAWANPSTTCVSGSIPVLCITNIGGTATGGTSGLVLDGTLGSTASTINQIGGFTGNGDLGTISFTTGAFTGNLGTGGTFAPGTFTITGDGQWNGLNTVLFSGTFGSSTIPITWALTGTAGHGKTESFFYTLSGPISGLWYNGVPVSGSTTQLFFESKGKAYGGGSISLAGGSTGIVVPEPGSLGLMGTGLLGIGLTVRQRVRAKRGKNAA